MTEEENIDPEELLKAIKAQEKEEGKGHLKIFFGMAPGVGKTYAMLETAQKKVKEGVDLIVGIVNTHKRPETAKLLEGLKILPQSVILYKNIELKEFNLDKALELRPELIIIDELAHSNIPGSRNEKRWQDVLELLDAGIDVYTTLNVQHIESYKDIVHDITGIQIWETVPDLMLEKAINIELVDLTPQELLERLREGKVYTGEMSAIAIQNFFQEDRLTALREIALLVTAGMVDKELHEMFTLIQKKRGWKPRERLLVAIDEQSKSKQLIRAMRRRAFILHAPWIVLYVDTGKKLSDEDSEMLNKNLALARELGAEIITTKDIDIARGIQRIVQQHEITEILIGKSAKSFKSFFKPALINQLIKKCSQANVKISVQTFLLNPPKKNKIKAINSPHSILSYLYIIFWIGILTALCAIIVPFIGHNIIGFLFLLTIYLLSLCFKQGPLLLATVLFVPIWDFFFIPPLGTLAIDSSKDRFSLLLFFSLALIIGMLTRRIKDKFELLSKREQSTQAIYEIVREIAIAPSASQVYEGFKQKVSSILKGTCEIMIKNEGSIEKNDFDEKEKAVANWVLKNGKEAGWSTATLSAAQNLHIPLKGFKEIVGVLSYHPTSNKKLSIEESNFLHTAAQQLANYIERSFSETREREHLFLQKIEKIYNRVLHRIVKELEQPLQNIKNAISTIKKEPSPIQNSSFKEIERSTDTLVRVIENARDMEKLSTGFIEFEKFPYDIRELIDTCAQKVDQKLKEHQLIIKIAQELPKITFDFSLMQILLNNLLLNAIEYSPAGTSIEIEAECIDGSFVLSVADEGPGIQDELIDKIFEKFYRVPGATSPGLGLGLAIVSSIASIHQGEIRIKNRPTGGAKFFFILPFQKSDSIAKSKNLRN